MVLRWGEKKVVFGSILFLILCSFIVFGATNSEPSEIYLEGNISELSFVSGEPVLLDFVINFTGPISPNTLLNISFDDMSKSKKLKSLLDYQEILYDVDGENYRLLNSNTNVDLIYTSAGDHLVYLMVDTVEDVFESISFGITGSALNPSYSPYLDFGNDGLIEWQYFGGLTGYVDEFSLPDELNENGNPSEIIIKNEALVDRTYWCEEIDLPYTRDLEVYASIEDLAGLNLTATLLQLESPSCVDSAGCEAYGGQFECKLETVPGTANYYNCSMDIGYAVENEYLICLYNEVDGDGTVHQGKLNAEQGGDTSAYTCKLEGSSYVCNDFASDDFFIKVKGGDYTYELGNFSADFGSSLVNSYAAFEHSLNNQIENCIELSGGGCAIPLRIGSLSPAAIAIHSLDMYYTSSGATKSKTSFYMTLIAEEGSLIEIGDLDLLDLESKNSLSMDTSGMFFFVPQVDDEDDYEFTVELMPGPQVTLDVTIGPSDEWDSSGYNESSTQDFIKGYISSLNYQTSNFADVLSFLELSDSVTVALSGLNSYLNSSEHINYSNSNESQNFLENLTNELDAIVLGTPQSIEIVADISEQIIAEPQDILIDMVAGGEEERVNAYHHQNDFIVNSRARHLKVELQGGVIIEGTWVEKNIAGTGTDYYLYETIPGSLYVDPIYELSFKEPFEMHRQVPNLVYRKEYSSLNNVAYSYFVRKNIAFDLSSLKTILIPKTGISEVEYETVPVCGDGVCSVLVVDGERVSLEDAVSCPEDCSKKVNWTGILVAFMIGLLLIVGMVLYFKLSGGDKINSTLKRLPRVFNNPEDEFNLKKYVSDSIKGKKTKEVIVAELLKRGWSKEQVDYVFKNLNVLKKK
ncbi:hypothetical protein HN992_01855 [Candidatus Woesearchaeota archaeon]|jgi:hypothetical protein|nr:hypothetical protein [Candidatus Woesearchaeota archaeon]MBT3439083.1 hypothetical protein [Candidatus Woesearchaeota archaeon]MBT4057948.1 hypothetical protein [Candidatus Woesearchaeota archaeon]MBT4207216.1 hypothetical protein [Candidatus Woesearchaeota archaeon]MBT4732688.1 hypothetical protein [Candidatus Woesearchaeota archaeon]